MSEDIYDADACPRCGISWIGEPIPQEDIDKGLYGTSTHFKRGPYGLEYGYPNPEEYDGISEWHCPDCKTRWGRWTGKELRPGEIESRFGAKGVIKV